MMSNRKKNEPGLGNPIPMGVIDVANEIVDVPVQEAGDPKAQLSALRDELEALKVHIAAVKTHSAKTVAAAPRDIAAMIERHPATAIAMLGIAIVAMMMARSRLEMPPFRNGRGIDYILDTFDY